MEPDTPPSRILDAAEQAFSEQGFAGARVGAIAEAAGVNKAMLYYYFGSKDDLYDAVLSRVADKVVALAGETLDAAKGCAADRLESFVVGYRDILLTRTRLPRIVFRDVLDGGERLRRAFAPRLQVLAARLVQTILEGQAEGSVNPNANPYFSAIVIIAPIVVYANARHLFEDLLHVPPELTRPVFESTHSAVIMNGLRARTAPPEGT